MISAGLFSSLLALRQVFVLTDSLAMVQPELRVPKAGEKFDAGGELMDEDIRARLRAYVEALVAWARLVEPWDRLTRSPSPRP